MKGSHEARLSRVAKRMGLELVRSGSLLSRSSTRRTYGLFDPIRGCWILADPDTGYGKSLVEIEQWLIRSDRRTQTRG